MPSRRTLLSILLLLAVLGALWRASQPEPLGPVEGTQLEGEATRAAPGKTFRIATFNIHGCKGADGVRDVARVAECLAGLDFVGLNEVHGPRFWQETDQAGELGLRTGLAWLFAPNTRTWHHLDSGNGLLSAMPVRSWQRIPLAQRADRGYRNVVLVGLEHRGPHRSRPPDTRHAPRGPLAAGAAPCRHRPFPGPGRAGHPAGRFELHG